MKAGWLAPFVKALGFSVFLTSLSVPTVKARSVRRFSEHCAAVYASMFEVPVQLVEAIIQAESDWNPYAISSKGAVGLMQLMPATAIRFGVKDRFDITENIRGGVAYLAWLMRLFRGDLRLVVAAYQAGESPVLSRGLAYSSPEVFRYVSRVAQLYRAMCEVAARKAVISRSAIQGSEQ